MENFLVLVQIIALCCLSILCIYIVFFLVRMRNFFKNVELSLKDISSKAAPVLDNLEFITDKVRNIAINIDEQIEDVKYSINSIREIADNIVIFEKQLQKQIEGPVLETISTLAAFFKGIRTFFERIKK